MAVAVKTSPEARPTGAFTRLAPASLAGVVYVLAALAVVFKGLPLLWARLGLSSDSFGGVALEGLGLLAAGVALVYVGLRLLGPAPRPGIKAGIFMGLVLLLFLALAARWVGGLVEEGAYSGWSFGLGFVTAIAAVVLLFALWLFRAFFRPGFEAWLERFEDQGWFSAKPFKPGQGMRVRRGTILGILLLAGAGIWVMLQRGAVGRDNPDAGLDIPFTGKVVVTELGDALAADRLKPDEVQDVRVLDPGDADEFKPGTDTDRAKVEAAVEPLAKKKLVSLDVLVKGLQERARVLEQSVKDTQDLAVKSSLEEERVQLLGWIEKLKDFRTPLAGTTGKADLERFLAQSRIDQFVKATQEHERDRKRVDPLAEKRESLKKEMDAIVKWRDADRLPVVAPVLSRFRVRDVNEQLDPLRWRVVRDPERFSRLPSEFRFTRNQLVSQTEFEGAVEARKKQLRAAGQKDDKTLHDAEERLSTAAPPAKPMEGRTVYASITLLPAVRYTLPLVLLALTIWLAWRIVNLPTFGDFLIATEAEMNKVSWTTRARLWQDTVVVLVTTILLALFLFVVDIAWAKVLSWNPIGVLKVSDKKDSMGEADLKW